MYYYQCDLSRGTGRTRAYIEERGAKVGNEVEIIFDDGRKEFWKVDAVSIIGLSKLYMKNMQNLNRNSLPSIL